MYNAMNKLDKIENVKVGFLTVGTAIAVIATVTFIILTYKQSKVATAQLEKLKDEGYGSDTILDTTVRDLKNLIGVK